MGVVMYHSIYKEHLNGKKEYYFTVEYINPPLKKPCLCVCSRNGVEHIKVATFNNEKAVEQFIDAMREFLED